MVYMEEDVVQQMGCGWGDGNGGEVLFLLLRLL